MLDDQIKEDIRRQTDMLDLCRELGLEPKGKVARCPAHADQGRPNLAIYADHVHCYACDWHADAFALVAKVKGLDFAGAFAFLAARAGHAQGDRKAGRSSRGKKAGLGNRTKGKVAASFPKPVPLPPDPSPTLQPVGAVGLGNDSESDRATVYPKPPAAGDLLPSTASSTDRQPLPPDLWQDFDSRQEAWAYFRSELLAGYRKAYRYDKLKGRFAVVAPTVVVLPGEDDDHVAPVKEAARRQSLRAEVFAALLGYARPLAGDSPLPAGAWLEAEKGISFDTQDRFGLCWLDWEAAATGLVGTFGEETLDRFGLLTKAGELHFRAHRLLFPFYWKGEAVDVQGRNFKAQDKSNRFCNTGGNNPIPYNADALQEAKTTGEPVFLCEGASDTLTLAQSGRLAVGIVGTGGLKPAWLPGFRGLKVFFAFDNDDAGRKAVRNYTKLFVDAGLPVPKAIKLPPGIKDITDFFRSVPA